MASKLVSDVNAKLRAEHAEAVGHRENPRIITLLAQLIRLTNTDEQTAEDEKAAAATVDPKEEKRKELQANISALQKQMQEL